MQLQNTIINIEITRVVGGNIPDICGIETDSRKVSKGSMFVALPGTKVDGHTFIDQAIEAGAAAIVCEKMPARLASDVVYIQVPSTARALGMILSNYYDNPSSRLKIVGVTGTNGKTTTATLLYKMFTKMGHKSGLLSTVINFVGTTAVDATHTTPDAIQLFALLARMVSEGCEYCFMEVSSHAIHQHRISGITYAGGIFSNITHDHLDYHGTFDEYLKAKKLFFDALPEQAFALTNVDDRNGNVMLQNTKAHTYTYSCKSFSDYKCKVIEKHFDGMLLLMDDTEVWVKFIGDFNAYNLLAVYAAARLLGAEKSKVLEVLSSLVPVDGRFEVFRSKNDITAIVDYAHTPDALVNVLDTIKKLNQENKGQVIAVVGAGGDRDKTKRPVMAKVSVEMSDKLIITADNPRSEDPAQIATEMVAGIPPSMSFKAMTVLDRRDAIKTAIHMARPGDIILIAGKGHETYQEIKGVKHHFDDREIVKEVFGSMNINR